MNEPILGYKLLLSYDIKQESLQEYYQFLMGRYVPAIQSMGMQMSEAWHTAYGRAPNRLVGFVCSERQTIDALLSNNLWKEINGQLEGFVTSFSYKVIPYRGGFQI